ncbi:MAG: TetR/AcrR family transcriptional regulator [Aquidulcibacter sp.]|jgi:AcrR family transcriptional regulator|uniref:TetR/AcrR family transcriptional regulator n=1 Tax=Aquidulcibacter sp. TaxID=2052990 RepID=UPI0022BC4019|nr:TetR/AcrR family transcriptional regulator [Aquidulcibacter sp.]MCE2990579.1 TetR/AcrR family transcriptional regulator [Nitrosomonadaceae bacterium]MCZ8208150.1 TetR/AcrR family transcriptional regulator [Aquidulcibacter sp.]
MPKIVDHGERRAEFIVASWGVIAQEGLNAATLRRVAAAAGVTTGALTHYFSDREALLVEALRAAHFAAGARMLRAAAKLDDERKRLIAVLEEALPLDKRRQQEWRVWLAFWGEAVGSATLLEENQQRINEWRDFVEMLAVPLVPLGHSTSVVAMSLIALVDGLGLRLALAPLATLATERSNARASIARAVASLVGEPNVNQSQGA